MQNLRESLSIKVTYSDYILPLIRAKGLAKVHSQFTNSLNLIKNNRLIHISGRADYLSSFGLRIDSPSFYRFNQSLGIGDLVKLNETDLRGYGQHEVYHLPLEMNGFSPRIGQLPLSTNQIMQLADLIAELNDKTHLGLDPVVLKGQSLMNSTETGVTVNEHIVQYLIGRGQGLTPSGDDILMGYFFIMLLMDDAKAEALALAISPLISRTTIISQEYLHAIMEGYVSLPIYNLYLALKVGAPLGKIRHTLSQIIAIGSTSGRDTLYGMELALNYFKEGNK